MKIKQRICNFLRLPCINGKNNKVIMLKNGKEKPLRFLPRGLTLYIRGNNNVCKISLPTKYKNTKIELLHDDNKISIGKSEFTIANASFRLQEGGIIEIGNECQILSGNVFMICCNSHNTKHKIQIGNEVYIAQDVVIRCGDSHTILNADTKLPLNEPQDIIIEDNVWLTTRSMILKKAHIPSGSVVAAYSVVNKQFSGKNLLIGGIPAKIIKENITWDKRHYCEYIEDNNKSHLSE